MWDFIKDKFFSYSKLIDQLNTFTENTPDAVKLEQSEFQYVFNYGRTMLNHPDMGLMDELDGSVLCAHAAFTEDSDFILWKSKKGKDAFPIPLRGNKYEFQNKKCSNIKGELWKVRSQLLFELDKYMKNTILFERQMVNVIIPQRIFVRDKETHKILSQSFHVAGWQAWMYLGKEDIWGEHIDGGYKYGTCKRYREHKKFIPKEPLFNTYYYFTLREYDE